MHGKALRITLRGGDTGSRWEPTAQITRAGHVTGVLIRLGVRSSAASQVTCVLWKYTALAWTSRLAGGEVTRSLWTQQPSADSSAASTVRHARMEARCVVTLCTARRVRDTVGRLPSSHGRLSGTWAGWLAGWAHARRPACHVSCVLSLASHVCAWHSSHHASVSLSAGENWPLCRMSWSRVGRAGWALARRLTYLVTGVLPRKRSRAWALRFTS